jgi:hypothetical protein
MLIKGEMLRGSFTLTFSMHRPSRNQWTIAVAAPGGVTDEREIRATEIPYALLDDILTAAYQSASHQRIPNPVGARQ